MTPQQLKEKIETLAPGTHCDVMDLTGTQDHYQALVVSPLFEGKMMIEQHRLVMDLLKSDIDSNEVHALSLKTFTPDAYKKLTGE